MEEKIFVEKILAAGGKPYVVGGWVRDKIRQCPAQDKDYVVTGITPEEIKGIFPESKLIGRSFPVFLLKIAGRSCEVAFARKERKIGTGYTGFAVETDKAITIEEDLYRRDLTINSMAMDLCTGAIIDIYGGQQDIQDKVLRPVSEHFCEDPVRALRAARFAAQLEFQLTPELKQAMTSCGPELAQEPQERILGEFKKALGAKKPSLFFRALAEADLLELTFPEIYQLIGKTQPVEYHPEGDAFEHTMEVVDRVAGDTSNLIARFAGLAHDLGKSVTPIEILPHHYQHEEKGGAVLQAWNKRMVLPGNWIKIANFVIEQHMRMPRLEKPRKIMELMNMLYRLRDDIPLGDIMAVIRADHNSLPYYLEDWESLMGAVFSISGREAPEKLHGPALGKWLEQERLKACQNWLEGHRPKENNLVINAD